MEPTTERDSLKSPFTLSQWLLVAMGTGLSGLPAWWYLQVGEQTISPLWITAGVSMAFFACYGRRAAPAVVAGHLALGWLTAPDRPMSAALGLAVVLTAEAWLVSVAGYQNRRMTAAWRYLAAAMLLRAAWCLARGDFFTIPCGRHCGFSRTSGCSHRAFPCAGNRCGRRSDTSFAAARFQPGELQARAKWSTGWVCGAGGGGLGLSWVFQRISSCQLRCPPAIAVAGDRRFPSVAGTRFIACGVVVCFGDRTVLFRERPVCDQCGWDEFH